MSNQLSEFNDDREVYKTLLESTKAIPWKMDWATMKFDYIGPQIEPLLGWKQDSWLTVDDWASRIHPDDRDHVVNFCVSQSKAGIDHEADYRALTKDNGFIWIRDVVHVKRKPDGEVDSLVGFMFDISERKLAEQKLISLQKELEALSFKDALTGVSNRRKFETTLDMEWASARRNGNPLSVILLDVDYFKQYNDKYGHLRGDECLQKIAQTLELSATRPRDIVARYGGEEFAIVLPETDELAIRQVADRCITRIEKLQIRHENSTVNDFVTISLGVGTVVPSAFMEPKEFFESVDKLLYRAKQNGRNRIEYGIF